MAVRNFTKLFLKYPGYWVALDQDEKTVLAASKSAKKAYREALQRAKHPVLLRVPLDSSYYAGVAKAK